MLMLFYFMFIWGLWVFCSSRKHLLMTLFSLEVIILTLFIILYYYVVLWGSELYISMFFLTFAVWEGALGLSILVFLIWTPRNDFFDLYNLLQC
uniref:NADH-ubiquinone oxidoreductase chain 4L n=1 Tax=Schizocephala bicornis TaxID=444990 RepID=A0A343UN82_9NEOP|nr:NADH dehydrogenase subunit 4L [Schizocephala bicornis]AVE15732.1 NADH dehydrogenase subunit 4L [Schizocephala bicornis]